jgi:hypothetical protein
MAKHDDLTMVAYSTDENGKTVWKRVGWLISNDPVFLWNSLYNKGGCTIGLNTSVYNRLTAVIQTKFPDLYEQKEERKARYKKLSS